MGRFFFRLSRPAGTILASLGCVAVAGCAGPVALRSGAQGPLPQAGVAIAIMDAGSTPTDVTARARKQLASALAAHGLRLGEDGGARIEYGLTSRPASIGIAEINGQTLSPPKRHRLFQSCKDNTYRLTLTYFGPGEKVPVSRAWAEEYHCHGTLEASVASLADAAVAALATASPATVQLRAARD